MTDGKIAGELDVQINSFRNILLNDQHALGMATSQLRVLRNLETEDADKVAEVEREIQVLRVNIVSTKDTLENLKPVKWESDYKTNTDERSGKLPSDLPMFTADETDIGTFFDQTEAKLLSHSTPIKDWYKALGKQTTGTSLVWVSKNILQKTLTWEQAKTVFTAEFTSDTAVGTNRDKMMDMKQGDKSCGVFLREMEQLAPGAQQDLNNQFFLSFVRRRQLNPDVSKALSMQLAKKVDTLTFAQLKSYATFYESIINAPGSKQKKKKTTFKCTYRPCGSTEHDFETCPLRLSKQCTSCKKFGHLADECRSQNQDTKTRDLSQVQCHKCKEFGHYANKCTADPTANALALKPGAAIRSIQQVDSPGANYHERNFDEQTRRELIEDAKTTYDVSFQGDTYQVQPRI